MKSSSLHSLLRPSNLGRRVRSTFLVRPTLVVATLFISNGVGFSQAQKQEVNLDRPLSSASQLFMAGDAAKAIEQWQSSATTKSSKSSAQQVRTLLNISEAQASLGQWDAGILTLQQALALATRSGGTEVPSVQAALGDYYARTREIALGEKFLNDALTAAQKNNDQALTAQVWNSQGTLRVLQERNLQAGQLFEKSLGLAKELGNRSLSARAAINLATLTVHTGDPAVAANQLATAESLLAPLQAAEKVHLLASLSVNHLKLAQREGMSKENKDARLDAAQRLVQQASTEAEALKQPQLLSLLQGQMGAIAEQRGDTATALQRTRQARFLAQQVGAASLLYRWEWQMGRLQKAAGQPDEAIASYRRSIASFRTLCQCGGMPAFASYDDTVRPLYYQLADLLLQQGARKEGSTQGQKLLTEARDTVELVKTAELSDYFQDACVVGSEARSRDLSEISSASNKSAVLYYVPLPDRLEILLELPSGLQRVTSPIASATLMARARRMRLQLQRPSSDGYLAYSKQLYDSLIRPVAPLLRENGIQTLVFVLDGSLRTIPMAALNDGERFLIEQYKITVAPSLTLLDPRPLSSQGAEVFAGGISDAVQGFDALQSVPRELSSIKANYAGTTLLNQQFSKAKMESQITEGNFSIVHLASHGEFGSTSDSTYLLTYDGKVTLNELEGLIRPRQYRGTPVELLVLSACQTAAGDDRAALGLAGVAIKAGARSAVASLWSVSDEATAQLIANFYSELKNHPEASKAAALQQAQLNLLKDERFSHPSFWAPYLLIGNWT